MMLVGGYLADKLKNKRSIVVATGFSIMAIGYLMLLFLHHRWGM